MLHYQCEEITHDIIISVYNKGLGPGLLESTYKTCLLIELEERKLRYKHEMIAPLVYKNKRIDSGFRIDAYEE